MTAASASAKDVPEALTLFLREIGRYPLLDAREEIRLARRIERGDPDARERLITSNLRLVVYVAKRFSGSGLQLVDLVQDGTLGLIRAADRFMNLASAPTLEEAVKLAVRDAVDLLVEEKGLTEDEAYMLITVKADIEICQVVDPLMTVRVAMDREFFETLAPEDH